MEAGSDIARPGGTATWTTAGPLIEEWRHLTQGLGEPRRLPSGRMLFRRDDPSDGIFLLEEGLAKATSAAANGTERLVEIMGPGCLFGEGSALDRSPRIVSVVALSPMRLRFYRTEAVLEAMGRDAGLGLCLIRIMAAKQRSLAHRLTEVSALTPRERLLDFVGRLREAGQGVCAGTPELGLTHEEIASYLGLSRVTVTRWMGALRREGVVRARSDTRTGAS